jgi:hypothetical protein
VHAHENLRSAQVNDNPVALRVGDHPVLAKQLLKLMDEGLTRLDACCEIRGLVPKVVAKETTGGGIRIRGGVGAFVVMPGFLARALGVCNASVPPRAEANGNRSANL